MNQHKFVKSIGTTTFKRINWGIIKNGFKSKNVIITKLSMKYILNSKSYRKINMKGPFTKRKYLIRKFYFSIEPPGLTVTSCKFANVVEATTRLGGFLL